MLVLRVMVALCVYIIHTRVLLSRDISLLWIGAPVHHARFISAKAIAAMGLDWSFPQKSLKGRNLWSPLWRVAHNDNGNYKRRPSVSHSKGDVCLRNMIKRSRLSRGAGLGWRGMSRRARYWADYRHENDHLSGFINFLDGVYYMWRIVRRWNKAE